MARYVVDAKGSADHRALRCPHCEHAFLRFMTWNGTTSCPRCRRRAARTDFRVKGDEQRTVRSEAMARAAQKRKDKAARVMPRSTEAIRGAQVPASVAEARFKALIERLGGLPHRPSWPDFLVEIDGKIVAVEVKKDAADVPTPEQRRTFALLERLGLPVYLWTPKTGKARRFGSKIPIPAVGERPEPHVSRALFQPKLAVTHAPEPAAHLIRESSSREKRHVS